MPTTEVKKVKLPMSAHLLRIFYLFVGCVSTYVIFAAGCVMCGFTSAYFANQYGIRSDNTNATILNIMIWVSPMIFATLALFVSCFFAVKHIWIVCVRKFKAQRAKWDPYYNQNNQESADEESSEPPAQNKSRRKSKKRR